MVKVLITGAASGIGYQVGVKLAQRKHEVYMCCKCEKEVINLEKKLQVLNIKAKCFKFDLFTDDISFVDNLDIDCLFNNAGIGISGSILCMSDDSIRKVYEINVFKSFLLLKRIYWNMVRKKIPGKIFITSSLISMFPLPFLGIYSSSKAALSMLSKTLQKELKILNSDIKICLVEPGAYQTGFNQLMIDSCEKYIEDEFYDQFIKVYNYQQKLFRILESKNIERLSFLIVREMERKKTKKILRIPYIQGLILKIYYFFLC